MRKEDGRRWRCGRWDFSRVGTPPHVMPDPDRASFPPPLTSYPRMRVSRAIIPYFSEVSTSQKSGISVAWMLAFARRTAGGGVAVRDNLSRTVVPLCRHPLSLTRGSRAIIPYFSEVSMSIKAVSMLPGCSPAQGGRPEVVSPSGTTCRERWFPSVVTL